MRCVKRLCTDRGKLTDTGTQAYPNYSLGSLLSDALRAEHVYASLPPSPSPSASSQPFQPPPPRRRSSLLKLFTDPSSSSSSTTADPPHLLLAAALASEKAKPLEKEVQALRMVKSPAEIRLMKRAADISAEAHTCVMRAAQAGRAESQLVAEFEYRCALEGAERPAYVPVVASGSVRRSAQYRHTDEGQRQRIGNPLHEQRLPVRQGRRELLQSALIERIPPSRADRGYS